MRTMIGKYMLSTLLLSVLTCGIGLSGEAQTDSNSLTFEMSAEEVAWRQPIQGDKWQPVYAVTLPLNTSDCFQWYIRLDNPNNLAQALWTIREMLKKGNVSKEQELFIESWLERNGSHLSMSDIPIWTWIYPDEIHNRPRQVLLYAMSLDDAKKMAQAYWDLADGRYRYYVKDKKEGIQRYSNSVEYDRKRLAELEDILKKAPVEFEELKKKVTYHDANQALEVIPDLDKAIHACTIDIAGIRTKLEGIRNYLTIMPGSDEINQKSIRSRLEAMSIEESIALKAAEARLKTATDLRTQAQRYVDLTETLRQAPNEKEKVQQSISSKEASIQGYERQLAETIPPAIPGGKVFIHKVRIVQGQP